MFVAFAGASFSLSKNIVIIVFLVCLIHIEFCITCAYDIAIFKQNIWLLNFEHHLYLIQLMKMLKGFCVH